MTEELIQKFKKGNFLKTPKDRNSQSTDVAESSELSKESSGILLTYQKSFDNMLSRFDMKETDETDGNNTDEFEADFLSR